MDEDQCMCASMFEKEGHEVDEFCPVHGQESE